MAESIEDAPFRRITTRTCQSVYVILALAIVTGRITRLIEHQQIGIIAAEDGNEYEFKGVSLSFGTFGGLSLGAKVMFEPITPLKGGRRASAVRLVTK
jgi:hypothetical protein